jgi:hypothetical protein
MFIRNTGQIYAIAIAMALMVVCAGANAEQTVYKWVDADGIVHFSDAPPAASDPVDVETVAIPKSPPAPPPAPPVVKSPVASTPDTRPQSGQPETPAAPRFEKIDISAMSLPDLDRRCDEAREKKIAPLRAAEIAECQQDKRNDPAWCERFNADFGDAGRTVSGFMRPRMFDDLPECVEALQERNRRGL